MSGLIQRLLDRTGAAAPAAAPVVSLAQSASPLATADQRLQDPAFRELIGGVPTGDIAEGPPDEASAMTPEVPITPTASPRFDAPDRRGPYASPIPPVPPPKAPPQAAPKPPPATEFPDPIAALRAAGRNDPPARAAQPAQPVRPPEPQDFVERDVKAPLPESPAPAAAPRPPAAPEPREAAAADVARSVEQLSVWSPLHDPAVTARPLPATPPVPEVGPRPEADHGPAPQRPEPPQMLDPILPHVVMAPTPESAPPDTTTSEKQETVERIVERVLERQPATPPPPQPRAGAVQRRTGPPTAESVSLIGALPQRRSVHTLFGLRRP